MSSTYFKSCIIFFIVVLNSCTNQSSYQGRYIIENATDRTVKIKFYDRQRVGEPVLVFSKTIDGAGIVYDEHITLYSPGDNETAQDVFGADSLAVIFDGEKIQAHYEWLPFENSLSNFEDYVSKGNTKRYIITEENYEDAVDCNGNCN